MKDSDSTIQFNYPDTLVQVLESLGQTLAVSTYQSGIIFLLGQDQGNLDVQYKVFKRPMGMCTRGQEFWAGIGHSIWHFKNFSMGQTAKETPEGEEKPTQYLPLNVHLTGDIDIHEMACTHDLYFVNTRFSCLCINDGANSFTPIWKPPFITSLQPVDKCHLNGLGLRDGEPRYVTALGTSDTPLGWREDKACGGILMDIKTDEILLQGLSMPHSPRWHRDKIWFLESGKGSLCRYDAEKKSPVEVAQVPGFTRGMEIMGDYAFIGVSKVRESATFSGLPITQLPKRACGVWVVNIQTGELVSFFEFTSGIHEIFSINLLPHPRVSLEGLENPFSAHNYMVPATSVGECKMPETPIELATPHFEEGMDLFDENQKEKAIEAFQRALDIQADHLPATFNMAIALGDLGRFEEAENLLLNVIERDAAIVETYNSLGYVYYKKGETQRAREYFEKAIELDPNYVQAKTSLELLIQETQSPE